MDNLDNNICVLSENSNCSCCCRRNHCMYTLRLHDKCNAIHPGDTVLLHRFSSIPWIVGYGWFSYEGNRKICGWYLVQKFNHKIVKPVQEIDLDDIYVIQE